MDNRLNDTRQLIYVCSPYCPSRGAPVDYNDAMLDIADMVHAIGRQIIDDGNTPIIACDMFDCLLSEDICEDRCALHILGLSLLQRSAELWVVGDTITEQMAREIDEAHFYGIPVVIKHPGEGTDVCAALPKDPDDFDGCDDLDGLGDHDDHDDHDTRFNLVAEAAHILQQHVDKLA